MVALPTPRPSQVDIDAFEEATRSEMREAMRRARAPMAADIDLGDPESFDFAMTGGITGSGRALIRDPLTGDLRTSQEPAMILTDKQRQAGNFAQGLAMGLTTDLLGLPADLLALILRDAPQLGAALTKSLTSGTPVAEEVAEMSKNPSLLDQALTIVQGTLGGDAFAKYAGMTEEDLQDPALQTGRIAASAFDPFLLSGLGRRAKAGVETLTGEVMPDLPTGAPTRQEPSFNIGQEPEVVEGIGSLLPAPRTTDPGPPVGAPDTPVTTTPGILDENVAGIPGLDEDTARRVLQDVDVDFEADLGSGIPLNEESYNRFISPTGRGGNWNEAEGRWVYPDEDPESVRQGFIDTTPPEEDNLESYLQMFRNRGEDPPTHLNVDLETGRLRSLEIRTERMATPEETEAFIRGDDPADFAPGAATVQANRDDFADVLMQLEEEESDTLMAALVSNDRGYAADVAGELLSRRRGDDLGAAADPVNDATLNDVRAQLADEAEMFVERFMGLDVAELTPDTPITVFRVGDVEPGEVQSFSLSRNIEDRQLPGQRLREQRGEERQPLVEYTVRAGDILAAPNATFRGGRGTEDEIEVLIDSANVTRVGGDGDVIEGDFTATPATAPEADEAAELFDAAAAARAEPAEPQSSLFESPEGGAQYAYDAVQNEQIGVFQSLPDRRSSNKTFTINDNDQFGGQVANFSSTMTIIAGRGERGKLPKKAAQLDALLNKGVSKPEYNGSKLQEILKEDPDKSYTVDEIAKLAHDNLPQTRTRTYLASRHVQERDAGIVPDFFKTRVRYSYEVDPDGNIDLSPSDTQLLPELKDTKRDAGRIIFSTTKPPEPIVFSDGSVIDNIPFTVEKHDYGQGKYPGFYAHTRFVVVEDFDTGKRYLVPFEIQSDTINQIERARVAEGGRAVSARSLQDRLNKYNEAGNTGTNAGMVRIPLTEETKALIKKYDEEFPSELTLHQKAQQRLDELMGDVNGLYRDETGVMVDAMIPRLEKRVDRATGHPLNDSDVNGRLYNELENEAFFLGMKDDLVSVLNMNDANMKLDALRERVANGEDPFHVGITEADDVLEALIGYSPRYSTQAPADLIGEMNSFVERVMDARGYPVTVKNTDKARRQVESVLKEAIVRYVTRPDSNMQLEDYIAEAISRFGEDKASLYASAVRAKSLINQNDEVAKFFRDADPEDLEALQQARYADNANDKVNELLNKFGVTDEQLAIADEAVDAAVASLKTSVPAEAHSMIDTGLDYHRRVNVYKNMPFFSANDDGFKAFNELRHAMDEVKKVYESNELIQDADELARIETNYENKLSGMGEEGDMLRNLRKVLQDSGDGRYRGLIGIPPHKDNKQFFRFAPKAIIKEAEKLGLDGVIFLDGDDIADSRLDFGGALDMYRRTYDSELDKGLTDFQNASPDAVVRSGVNRRIPGDGNLRDPDNTFRARIIDNPEDPQLTAGAGIILGGRGQGLRIVDFDTGSNRQTAQRPIRRAKGGDVDLRPQKMVHSGIGAMAREVM